MKSLHTAFSFAPPSILSLTILMSLLYHNDTIMKNEKIVHGLDAKNNKKVYLEKATCICYNGDSYERDCIQAVHKSKAPERHLWGFL